MFKSPETGNLAPGAVSESPRAKATTAEMLTRKIFIAYLGLAACLTLVQIGFEYLNTYNTLQDEIGIASNAFQASITEGLWNFQAPLVQSIAAGIIQINGIEGIVIQGRSGHPYIKIVNGHPVPAALSISRKVDLFHKNIDGDMEVIGSMTFYTSHTAILDRVKNGLLLIIVSALIKTIGLWYVITYFIKKLLAQPLGRMATQIARFDIERAIETTHVDFGSSASTEFHLLENTFNHMMDRVVDYRNQLRDSARMLENKVAERTHELATQKEIAESANLAKAKFLAVASHDLGQPIHTISLLTEILTARNTHGETGDIARRIQSTAQYMEKLLEDLLDLSKLDAGVMKLCRCDFMLDELFAQIECHYALQAQSAKLAFRVHAAPYLINSDPTLLVRIIGNLIANAIRYTEQGGILLGYRKRGNTILIEVYDTGAGIAEAFLQEIFQEFYQIPTQQAPNHHGSGGLGLGLAIVQRSAAILEHRLQVKSRPGRGSLFSIEVPLAQA